MAILGDNASQQNLDALRKQLHLNDPLWVQFATYVEGLFQWDFGRSIVGVGEPVSHIILGALPVTAALAAISVLLSLGIGVPLGLASLLLGRVRAVERIVSSAMIVLLSLPSFLIGLVLIYLVALKLGWAPAGGWGTTWSSDLRFLWLPALALGAFQIPIVARTVQQTALDTWQLPFVEAAIARGLSNSRVVLRHVLPNSLLPIVTLVGYNFAVLLGGAVVVEVVFNLPGLGYSLVTAVQLRDYPTVQGIALVAAFLVVVVNLLVDLLYAFIDPRTRTQQ
jgi:peptide/nickel transport system permease protein